MKGKIKVFLASLGYLLLAIVVQVLVMVVGAIIVTIVHSISQGINAGQGGEAGNIDVLSITNVILSYTSVFLFISSILTVLILILIYKIRKKNYKEELQIKRVTKLNIFHSIFLGISCWLFNVGVVSLTYESGLFRSHFEYMDEMLAPLNEGSIIMAILTVGIIAPIAEEVLFRGVVYNTLSKKVSIKWTIIIQAILFGVFHGNIVQGIYATFIGLVYGYVTYKTKSLWPAIIMHIVNNTVATVLPYVLGENFGGNLVYIVFTIIGSIGIGLFVALIKKSNKEEVMEFDNIIN